MSSGLKNGDELVLFVFVCFLCLLGVSIFSSSSLGGEEESVVHSVKESKTLAQECRELYDPGNEDLNSPWKVCLGVEAE